jgi:hypothetical protein
VDAGNVSVIKAENMTIDDVSNHSFGMSIACQHWNEEKTGPSGTKT